MALQDDGIPIAASLYTPPRGVCPLRWAEMSAAAKRRILGDKPVMAVDWGAARAARDSAPPGSATRGSDGPGQAAGAGLAGEDRAIVATVARRQLVGLPAAILAITVDAFRRDDREKREAVRERVLALEAAGRLFVVRSKRGWIVDVRLPKAAGGVG